MISAKANPANGENLASLRLLPTKKKRTATTASTIIEMTMYTVDEIIRPPFLEVTYLASECFPGDS